MARSFRELLVWEKAMSLAEAAYAAAALLPESERFGLSQQIRRSAISIPSNIAEGHERRSRADYRRFVAIACGSLAELETQMDLAQRLYHLTSDHLARARALADETGRMLRSIERSLRPQSSPDAPVPQPSALGPQPS